MMRRWWTILKWIIKAAIAAWFFAIPLIPVYGWLRPWREAEEALHHTGVAGTTLMIGGGSSRQHSWSSAGHAWRKQEQRSFFVYPDSLRDWQFFTYHEFQGSGIDGTKTAITSSSIFPTLVLWILAGLFSMRTVSQLRKIKTPNKAPEPTPTSVTSPAAQEPRQP